MSLSIPERAEIDRHLRQIGGHAPVDHEARQLTRRAPAQFGTADEVIYVTSGEVRFGAELAEPGTSIVVTADRRYGFQARGENTFINVRFDLSMFARKPCGDPTPETIEGMDAGLGHVPPTVA